MRVVVRWAKDSDLPRAAEILEKSFTGSYRYWSLRLLNVLDVLVAEADGDVAGVAEVYVTRAKGYGRLGVIGFVAVDPAYRRRGIGRRLIQAAEEYFVEQGCKYSAASTRRDNAASINLFSSLGYRVYERGSGVFEELEAPLYAYEDDIIFLKSLQE